MLFTTVFFHCLYSTVLGTSVWMDEIMICRSLVYLCRHTQHRHCSAPSETELHWVQTAAWGPGCSRWHQGCRSKCSSSKLLVRLQSWWCCELWELLKWPRINNKYRILLKSVWEFIHYISRCKLRRIWDVLFRMSWKSMFFVTVKLYRIVRKVGIGIQVKKTLMGPP